MEHKVEKGDIWRACQTKDLPIRDWVRSCRWNLSGRAHACASGEYRWAHARALYVYSDILICRSAWLAVYASV